jgi:hypothetical protein
VEVYNPAVPNSGWGLLDVNHALGATGGDPARAWPRGGFVGNYLWAIGGNATLDTYPSISLIEKLFVGRFTFSLPVVLNADDDDYDENFGTARPLSFNAPQYRNFDTVLDFYDMYRFDLTSTSAIIARLSQIPNGSDYNLRIYDSNKLLWGNGNNPSSIDEAIPLTLAAGRYYVVVERVYPFGFPNMSNYRLIIEK